ncbi:hypothetical protein [Candidatus Borrarchaeum sp.]|uniref:hypothetical protein n=1 Tax=Candidatus Borrarchaeum sp. TaxID=2846742 RepID=UPI00257F3D8C|nr:hypothetical protein [Candidatus Borrarchaeum sp.]
MTSRKQTINNTTNLTRVIMQMKHKFDIILEVIATGKPLIVCTESRKDTELYVHTLAKLRPGVSIIPWTEDENTIFSLQDRNNIVAGVPIQYLMKLSEEENLTIINLVFLRIHSKVLTTKKWKDIAKYANKNIKDLGDERIYTYIQSQMEPPADVIQPQMVPTADIKCSKCGGPIKVRKISLDKVQLSCENCGSIWVE